MFHKIFGMFRCIQKSEGLHTRWTSDVTLSLSTSTSVVSTETALVVYTPPHPTQVRVKQTMTKEKLTVNVTKLTTLPPDLEKIQPCPSQCLNCDEVGIDSNGNWRKNVIYKWCTGDQIWKVQTGERVPFWCSLFFTRVDRQCFIPPVVVHQSITMSADLIYGIPDDWIVHVTPSGYMDRDGWYKAIRQFWKLSGTHAGNQQVLFFDGHNSYWDADTLDIMSNNYVHGFFEIFRFSERSAQW